MTQRSRPLERFPLLVEPPARIEPATPSLPWILHSPLCRPAFPQLAGDRRPPSNVLYDSGGDVAH
jgi:hypothetical protein